MKPIQVGITGGIGSGKSVVCQVLKVLGIPVYNADEESKKILDSDEKVIEAVIHLIGPDAYVSKGCANRTYIAGVVFNHPEKLQALNAILHPAVQDHYRNWVTTHKDSAVVAKEAAIMFESGSYKDMNAVVAVTAPLEIRINRVVERDGKNRNEIQKIIERQLSQDEVVKRSDFVICNDDQQLVIPQLLQILEKIKALSH
jgi:dephospho-CoA kinase